MIRGRNLILTAIMVAAILPAGCSHPGPRLGVQTREICRAEWTLRLEALDDDLVRFSLVRGDAASSLGGFSAPTPMVHQRSYPGPAVWRECRAGAEYESAEVRIQLDEQTGAAAILRRSKGGEALLARFTPAFEPAGRIRLEMDPVHLTHVYGLGEQFGEPGVANGNWVGRVRTPGCPTGNQLVDFNGGTIGNAQFPILYALGGPGENIALFIDHVQPLRWDFTSKPWTIEADGTALTWYVMTGPDLRDLRRDYKELVGRPPVPPRKMFGLWVSEYGYESWAELEDKLATLRKRSFPVDGFVMDLQWFGGIDRGGPKSRMGSLTWDTKHFPNPEKKIRELSETHGVGLITIEEPFVCKNLPDYSSIAPYFVRFAREAGSPVLRSWWGVGGMIDYTNPQAGDFWHDLKRQELVRQGVLGHWTDLSEPEVACNGANTYLAGSEPMARNLFAFAWAESIRRGYVRHHVPRRPFVLTRSGTSGIQRFGAALWSGDIGSNLSSLAAHLNVQMHMSLSGVDFFGADVGGFRRDSCDGDMDEMYTQWFADACAFDVPVRPHTSNLDNKYETAPDRVGHVASNRENLLLRYRLLPYLYSLAHEAYRTGEAVFPPLVYYFQDDPVVRDIADEKMIGPYLLVAAASQPGVTHRDVYLPRGRWTNFRTNEVVDSAGEWRRGVPFRDHEGIFRLPMFVREGAIVPMLGDAALQAITTRSSDAANLATDEPFTLHIYPSTRPTSFTVYEDDGATVAYQSGQVRETVIRQQGRGDEVRVTIEAVRGTYADAPEHPSWLLDVHVPPETVVFDIHRNGRHLPPPKGPGTRAWRPGPDGARTGAVRLGSGDRLVFSLRRNP